MTSIAEIIGMRKVEGCLGLEIETETERPYEIPRIDNWHTKADGSLRDFGQEYITRKPIKRDQIQKHLSDWKTGLGAVHRLMRTDSISTSVHVHVNVQELTPVQVLNTYLTGILLESVMSRFAGPDRCGNLFCLRTRDAEHQFNTLRKSVAQVTNLTDLAHSFNPGDYKYSNINLVPITGFGSIEFRVMRGTTDIEEIKIWTEAVHDLRDFAKQFNTPVEFLRFLKEVGPDGFMKKVLGDNFDHFKYMGYEKDIRNNYIYLADIASCRKSWELSEGVSVKKMMKLRPMDVPAMPDFNVAGAPVAAVVDWDENFEEEDM